MNVLNGNTNGTTNLVVIEPKDTKLDDITIDLPAAKTISILAATYENYNVKVITQTNNGEENLITNIVSVKKGDDLVVTGADASKVIFRGFYTLCDEGACTVTLGGEEEGVTITPDSPVGEALSDGSFMIYTYADSGVLADMLTEDDGETLGLSELPEGKVSYVPIEKTNAQENNDEGSHWGWIAGGIALAAVGIKAFDDSDNNVNTPTTGEVTITGTQTQGEILTADTSALMDDDGKGTFSYQWWASDADGTNNEAIADATSKALTLTQAQVGKTITVVVTHTDAQGTVESAITSAATAAVTNVNDPTLGDVTITKAQTGAATPAQGETLTADTSAVTDVDGVGTFTYQWQADDVDIVGATKNTLILTQAQVGKAITVVVIHTDAQGTVEPAIISMATDPVENVNDLPTGSVTIDGTAAEDQNLTADTSALKDDDGAVHTFTYQWQADGADIVNATSARLTLKQAHVGKHITVEVSYTDGQGTTETITSAPTDMVTNVNDDPTGRVTIDGTAAEDQRLIANTSNLADEDGLGTFTYQWWASDADGSNNEAISGETDNTLILTQAHVGQTITVVVSYTDGQNTPETLTSIATAEVTNINDDPVGLPTISGDFIEGETLTANTDAIRDADGLGADGFTYQWQAGDTDISGATGSTFVLTQAQVDQTITLKVMYTDGQGTAETVTSAAVATTVENVNDAPTITGIPFTTALQNTEYSFTPTGADVDTGDTLTYSVTGNPGWLSIDANTGELSGTPTNGDVGTTSEIVISVTDGIAASVSLPAFSIIVSNTNDAPTISGIPATTVAEDTLYSFMPDGDDIDVGTTLAYSITNKPDWAVFDPATGKLSGTPTNDDVDSTLGIVISVTDGIAAPVLLPAFSITVTNTNDAPTISGTPVTTVDEDAPYTFTPTGADVDTGATLEYSVTGNPDWLSINPSTGELSGTPTNDNVGTTSEIVISVTDGIAAPVSLPAFSIIVGNTNDAPTISGTPATTVDEDAPYTFTPTGIDVDAGTTLAYSVTGNPDWLSINPSTGELSGTPTNDNVGTTSEIVISVTDGIAAPVSLPAFSITVSNTNDAPTISGTPVTTVNEDAPYTFTPTGADVDTGATLEYSVTGNPDWLSINPSTGELSGTPTNDNVGTIAGIVISVSDGTLTTSLDAFNLEVTNTNDAPTISGTPVLTVAEDTLYSFMPDGDDIDVDDTLTYSVTGNPDWLSINPSTGELSGTPTNDNVGIITGIVISVTDGTVTTSLQPFDLTVTNENDAPTGLLTIEGTLTQGETLTADTSRISDPDGPESLTFSYQWLASDADGNNNEAIAGATSEMFVLTQAQVGKTITVEVSYTDGGGESETVTSAAVATTVENVNDAPIITGTPDATVAEDAPYSFTPTGADIDGDTLVYSITNKPAWATFDPATGELSGTPTNVNVGLAENIVISVTDNNIAVPVSLPAFSITVTNENDAPTITGTPDATVAEDAPYSFTPTGADIDGDTLVYSITADTLPLPSWLSFDTTTGALTGTPTNDNVGIIAGIVISVTDNIAEAVSLPAFSITVTNENDAPIITGTPDATVAEDAPYSFTPTGADIDGDTLVYSITNKPAWATFDPATGELSGTPTNVNVGLAENIVISVTDNNIAVPVSLPAFSITVTNENDAPTITGTPDATVAEDAPYSFTPTGADIDGDTLVYSITNKPDWATFDPATGVLSGTPTNVNVGIAENIVISVTDNNIAVPVSLPAFSITVTNENDAPTGLPTIDGDFTQGETLTADTSRITDPDGPESLSFTYQWQAGGNDITDATESTFVLTQAQVGQTITVKVSYTDNGGTDETLTSAESGKVANTITINKITDNNIINAIEAAENANTLITGTVAVDGTVTLTIGGEDRTVDAINGIWSYTLTATEIAAMGEGTETITARATDAAGNPGTASHEFTVDTQVSTLTINKFNMDDLITSQTGGGAIFGTVEAGSSVSLRFVSDDDTVSATLNINAADTSYSFWQALVPDSILTYQGNVTVTATATDAVHNTKEASYTFTVDTEVPLLTIDPVTGDGYINKSEVDTGNIQISGTFSSTLTLNIAGQDRSTAVIRTGSIWRYILTSDDLSNMGEGPETIKVEATDEVGNKKTLNHPIVVDTMDPTISIDNIDTGDNDVIDSNDLTTAISGTPFIGTTISGTVEAGSTVKLFFGEVDRSLEVRVRGDGTWFYPLTKLEISGLIGQGEKFITATAVDPAGNTKEATASFTIDTQVSDLTINPVTDGNIINAIEAAANANTEITGTVEAGSTVTLTIGNEERDAPVTSTTWSYTLTADEIAAMGQGDETITVTATDSVGNTKQITHEFTVDTIAPVFSSDTAVTVDVDENVDIATVVYTAQATDAGGITYSLGGMDANAFTIDAASGEVTLIAAANFAAKSIYTLDVIATDAAGNAATQAVTVTVNDVTPPVFPRGDAVSVDENTPITTVVYDAQATDAGAARDVGITYSLKDVNDADAFNINIATGEVRLNHPANFETKQSYIIDVIATDATGNEATQTVTVTVNDLTPPVFSSDATVTVDENADITTPVYTAQATDAGGITYTLSGDDANDFTIDATSGEVTLKVAADFENKPSYTLVVTATDATGNFATQTVTVNVNNVNEAPTGLPIISGALSQGATLTADISNIADPDGLETDGFSYQWQAGGTAIDGATGSTFVLTQAQVGETITVTVSYTDNGGKDETLISAESEEEVVNTITINKITDDNIINANEAESGTEITGKVAVDGTVRLTIGGGEERTVTSTDGTWSYPLTVAEITAMVDGDVIITATADDAAGNDRTESHTFTVDRVPPTISIGEDIASDDIINGSEVTTTITGTVEADSTVKLTIGNEDRDATVTGTNWSYTLTDADITAMGQGAKTITATATDAAGNTASATRTIIVDTIAPTIGGTPDPTVDQDVAYSFTPTGADSDTGTELTYSVSGNPSWLSINASTGELSGTPTNDDVDTTTDIVITVMDAAGGATSLPAFNLEVINVNDAPTITGEPAITVAEDVPYSFIPIGADVDAGADLVYSIANKPAWATFDSATGALTGTPDNDDVGTITGIVISVNDGIAALVSLPAFSITVTNVNDPTIGVVTIDGTATQGETLTANTEDLADEDGKGTFTYVWQADDAAIADATSATLTLTQDQVGKTITVVVTHTDQRGFIEPEIPSTPTAAVENVNDDPVGLPIISGALSQGATLTARIDDIADPDGPESLSFTYQWRAGDTDITGATGSTFELTQAQVGQTITVTVSYTDGGTTAETLTSATSEEVVNTITINEITDDNIINAIEAAENANTQITGTVAVDGTVTLTIGINTRTVDATNGTWSYTLIPDDINNLSEGANTITATANDTADNAHTESHTFTVDKVPPTIAINDITADNVINANEVTTTITGTVAAGSTVKLTIGINNDIDAIVTGTNWSYTLTSDDISAMGEGEEIITATATDTAGNERTMTRAITVDTVLPTITINNITDDNVINSNEVTTTITGTVEADSTVKLTIGINVRTADVSGTNWSYTLTSDDISAMGEGAETIEATATDTAGNERTMTRAITVDTVLPTITINDIPDGNTINADEVASGTQITGTVEAGSTVTLRIGDNTSTGTVTVTDTTWSYTLTDDDITAMGQGAKTITATATDSAGNTKDASLEITVDTVAPIIGVNPVTNDNIINANEAVANANTKIRGTVDTADTEVTLTIGNGDVRTAEVTSSTWSYTLTLADINAMGQGENTITARTTDPAGNEGTRSKTFTVDTIVPVFTSGAIASVDENAETTTVVYDAQATDNGAADAGITYSLSGTDADAFNIDAASGVVTLKASADYETKNSYDLVVTANDATNAAGNAVGNAVTQAVTVNVNNVNEAPTGLLTISGDLSQGATLTADISNIADPDGPESLSFSYQWQAGDTDITGATGSTFELTQAQVGQTITVTVSYIDGGGESETLTSAAVATTVENVNDEPTGLPIISGDLSQGATLTADISNIADPDGPESLSFSYQWQAGDTDITGATGSTFELTQAQVGQTITVTVSYIDGGGESETLTSAAVATTVENVNDEPTGLPIISGDLSQGATLTADISNIADPDGPESLSFSYQWQAGDTDITGATGSTFELTQAQVGQTITVTVSYIDGGGESETLTSAAVATTVENVNDEPTGLPIISGDLSQGATLTADISNIADPDGPESLSFSYQWQAGDTDITGATGSTFELTQAQVGQTITVTVSYIDGGGESETLTSAAVATTVENVNDEPTGLPIISGDLSQGATLTADISNIADPDGPESLSFSYQWQAGDTDITGATGSTFELTQAQVGQTITVTVSYIDGGGESETLTSAAVATTVENVNDEPTGLPIISGDLSQGATLTADISNIADPDGPESLSFSYQWQAGDTDITGATGSTFELTQAQVGQTITVTVSYIDGGGESETLTSAAVATTVENVNDEPTGLPIISGDLSQGATLTADISNIADPDGPESLSFSYQWQAGDTDITGATGSTFELTQAQVGQTITVTVSYIDGGGESETLTSAAVATTVENVNDEPTGLPTISGALSQGATLTAITGNISDPDGPESLSFTYQWLASGADISGATEETFVLTEEQVGETITVRVFYTDDGGKDETLISAESEEEVVNTITINPVTIDNTINASEAASSNTKITGTVAADGPVTLTIGGVDRIADVSTSDNTWSYTLIPDDITNLVEGANIITASAADASGIDRTENHTFDVDTIVPTISIDGDIAGDDIINAREAESGTEITGIVEAGSTVDLIINETLRHADVDGTTWSYSLTSDDIAAMGQGREILTITATDSAGNDKTINHNIAVDTMAPTIGGTPDITVDQDVAYSFTPTGADSDTGTNLTYSVTGNPSWLSIDASTGELSGTPTNDDVDTTIGIVITVMDAAGGATSLPAFNLEVINVNDAPTITGEPAITVAEDSAYSFMPDGGDIDVGGNALEYSIITDDTELPSWLNFDTATGALTGTPENDDVGTITGIVISVNDGMVTTSLPAFNLEVTNVNDPTTGVVTINGIAAEDQMLTANTSALADEDGVGTFNYVWQADGAAIAGETDNTLTLTQAHVGKIITVVVTYTDLRGFTESEITSTATGAVTNVNDAGAVAISGRVRDGQTLTATVTDDDGIEGVDISYQWQADNVAIEGATDNTLVLTAAQVGQDITVTVSYTDQLGEDENFTSEATIAVTPDNDPTLGDVTITGAATQGETLTANTEALEDEDGVGTFTYQWWVSDADGSNNEAIAGATSETFRLRQEQVGKTITVVVVHTDARGTVEPELTSAATAAVAVHSDAPTQTADITGVNDNVGGATGALADDEVTDDTTPTLSGTVSSALTSGQVLAIYDGSTKLGDATVTDTSWTFTPSELTAGSHSFTVRVENTALDLRGAVSDPREVKINTSISMAVNDNAGDVRGELNPAMRYILVKQTGEGEAVQLWLSEVEVLSGGVNVALGKTVTAGEVPQGQSQLSDVTNGVTATEGLSNGYASLPLTTDNWVLIDLGAHYYIDKVKLYAFRDVQNDRQHIRNVDIFASKENFSAQSYPELTDNSKAINLGGTGANPAYKTVLNYSVTTDDNTPTLLGTLATALGANEELAIYKGTTKLGVATVSADNTWTYTPTDTNPLADGKHKLKAVIQATGVTDIAEAHVIGAARTIEVDSTIMAPTQTATIGLVLVSIQNNKGFTFNLAVGETTGDTTPTLEGTLSAGLTGDQVLVIYDGNGMTKLGEATVTGTSWSYTPIHALATGSHSFTARVESPIGGISTSSSAREVIINSIINVEVTDDVGVEMGVVDNFTDDNTPTLSGALAIALGTNEELAIYNGNTKLGVATVNANKTWTYTPTDMDPLADGVYELKAIIQAVGKTNIIADARASSATSTITIVTMVPAQSVTIDGANDDVSTHGSATVALTSGVTTDDTTPTLTGILSAVLTNYQVLAIYDADDISTKLGDAVVTDTSWSYTPSVLLAGSHGFTARVENTVGALKGAVSSPPFVVNINPSISMTVTDNEGAVMSINPAMQYILLKQTGISTNELWLSEVEVFSGGVNVALHKGVTVGSYNTYNGFNPSGVTNGGRSSTPRDNYASNQSTDNNWVLIDLGANYHIDSVDVYAFSSGETSRIKNVDIFASSKDIFAEKEDFSSLSHEMLDMNPNVLNLGGTGSSPNYKTSIINPSLMTDDSTPTLSGTLATALGADEELAIYDGSTKLDTVTVNADKTWTYTPAETNPLAEGSHTLKAVIQLIDETDITKARVITAANTFTVDTTSAAASESAESAETEGATAPQAAAPQEAMYSSFASSLEATLTMQVNDDVGALTGKIAAGADTDDSTVSLTGTVTNFDTDGSVQVYDGETLLGNATIGSTVDGVTSWSYTPTALAIGSHTIAAFFVDGVGTPSTNSASTSFTVTATDTTFSAIATTDPISGLSVQTYSLASTAMDQTLDFSGVHPKISVVNIAGSGANTVKIQLDDVLQTDINLFNNDNGWVGLDGVGKHQLVVNGDADDTLVLDTDAEKENWILAAETTSNSDQTYLVYNHTDGISQVLVDQDLIGTGAII